jgi:D-amino-acid dehydrogenase
MDVKVVVVGGGVVGLCCARELARRGADVTLVERDTCGAGASSGNGGWVVPCLSTPIPEPGDMRRAVRWMFEPDSPFLIRLRPSVSLFGWVWSFWRASSRPRWKAGTSALLRLNSRTLELYDELRDTGVAFEMHRAGLVFAARTVAGVESYRKHFDVLSETGYTGLVDVWDRDEIAAQEPALAEDLAGAVYAHNERHVRPETLMRGLTDAVRAEGVQVIEHAPVAGIDRRQGKWSIEANGENHVADRVVIAAGVWTSKLLRRLRVRLPLQAAKGYSLTANGSGTTPRHALYLAEAKVGCSPFADGIRLSGTFELAGINLEPNPQRMGSLLRAAAPYLRDWEPRDPRAEWTGLRPLTPDGLPLIGAVPGQDGLYVATGHGMLGVTLAPATAALLSPLVLEGRVSPELEPFRPSRFARAHARFRA